MMKAKAIAAPLVRLVLINEGETLALETSDCFRMLPPEAQQHALQLSVELIEREMLELQGKGGGSYVAAARQGRGQ